MVRPDFRKYSPKAVIGSPAGRDNPVGIVAQDAEAMGELPDAIAGLPRRLAPRNDRGAG